MLKMAASRKEIVMEHDDGNGDTNDPNLQNPPEWEEEQRKLQEAEE